MAKGEDDSLPQADQATGCPHPRETYDLLGHSKAETKFINAWRHGRLHHAWLLTGPHGVGKATLAYRMVRAILGGQSQLETTLDIPRTDPVAQRIESLGHGDFFLLRRPYDHKTKKLRSEIPVAEARKVIDFFSRKPAEGGWRVCLIDSLDEMNRNAENAILKALEEPPDKTILILLSSRPGKLLPTIRSRCLTLSLTAVQPERIRPWLSGKVEATEKFIDLSAKLSRGSPGRSWALAQNHDAVLAPLDSFLKSLSSRDTRIDQRISGQLAMANASIARSLFWGALRDTLHQEASNAGSIPPLSGKSQSAIIELWDRIGHLQDRESAINMDKKSVMQTMLSEIRLA